MSDWFVNLPVVWMVLPVFGLTYVVSASIYAVVVALARGARASVFKAVSPGMLPPLGILFALFVAFTASEVWGNIERANTAVDREASAAKSVLVLAATFPGEPEARLRALIGRYIEKAVTEEWPSMAHQSSGLSVTPPSLAEALTAHAIPHASVLLSSLTHIGRTPMLAKIQRLEREFLARHLRAGAAAS